MGWIYGIAGLRYWVPEAGKKQIDEVRKMLELNVIEKSMNAWSSPITLTDKPDNTVHFLNDIRKISVEIWGTPSGPRTPSGQGLVKPQEAKLWAIQDWQKMLTQVRSFLGLANYYRRFIPDFAMVVAPLTQLTTKTRIVKWTPAAEKAFGNLKRALCAFDVGLGTVLTQISGGEEHPVLYLRENCCQKRTNYAIVEKECLAIKWGPGNTQILPAWKEVHSTDRSLLQWMAHNKETNSRVTRWFLQPFNFSVFHTLEERHGKADALSQRDVFWFTLPRMADKGTSSRGRGVTFSYRVGCHITKWPGLAHTTPVSQFRGCVLWRTRPSQST